MTNIEGFRVETRSWLQENCPESMRLPIRSEKDQCWGGRNPTFQSEDQRLWMERMAERGWTAPEWPAEYGGGGLSKAEAKVHKCWQPVDFGRTVHFEYNKEGTEVWVSAWDRKGQLLVYNDDTLEEIERITGDWLVTPTGKFNVYNTAADVY